MTPLEFVEAIRVQHTPYIPEIVEIQSTDPTDPDYQGGQWHEPSIAEKAAELEFWCDGCNTLASKCRVAHLLALVEVPA